MLTLMSQPRSNVQSAHFEIPLHFQKYVILFFTSCPKLGVGISGTGFLYLFVCLFLEAFGEFFRLKSAMLFIAIIDLPLNG